MNDNAEFINSYIVSHRSVIDHTFKPSVIANGARIIKQQSPLANARPRSRLQCIPHSASSACGGKVPVATWPCAGDVASELHQTAWSMFIGSVDVAGVTTYRFQARRRALLNRGIVLTEPLGSQSLMRKG